MTAVALTTTPVLIDDGSSTLINLENGGPKACVVSGQSSVLLQPGSSGSIAPAGEPVYANAVTGTANLTYTKSGGGGGSGLTLEEIRTGLGATFGPGVATDDWLIRQAKDPEAHLFGTLTRDSNLIVTGASFKWDDAKVGTYAATATSEGVSGYTVTYPGPPSKTVTQPTMTRTGGVITTLPSMTVS